MKKLVRIALIVLFTSLSVNLLAQQPDRGNRKHTIPSPGKNAKHIVDEMNSIIELNEKQYKKVYKLILKEQRAQQQNRPEFSGRPSMGGPEGDMDERMPPIMDDDNSTDSPQKIAKVRKKEEENKDKKLKKILTVQQFSKWKDFCSKRMDDSSI